jgi:hypothetical protein
MKREHCLERVTDHDPHLSWNLTEWNCSSRNEANRRVIHVTRWKAIRRQKLAETRTSVAGSPIARIAESGIDHGQCWKQFKQWSALKLSTGCHSDVIHALYVSCNFFHVIALRVYVRYLAESASEPLFFDDASQFPGEIISLRFVAAAFVDIDELYYCFQVEWIDFYSGFQMLFCQLSISSDQVGLCEVDCFGEETGSKCTASPNASAASLYLCPAKRALPITL